ncbi:MAG TPA: cation:proton antiporter [Streptosporangiaceae bacterium]
MAVIAALARICGVLARRVGQPEVVGEIVAGLILGPTVHSTLAPGSSTLSSRLRVLPNLGLLAGLAW